MQIRSYTGLTVAHFTARHGQNENEIARKLARCRRNKHESKNVILLINRIWERKSAIACMECRDYIAPNAEKICARNVIYR